MTRKGGFDIGVGAGKSLALAVLAATVTRCFVVGVSINSGSGHKLDDEDQKYERQYLQIPSATSARSSLHFLTRESHVAGTRGDRILAEFVATEMVHSGIPNAEIFDLNVTLNYPDLNNAPPSLKLVSFQNEYHHGHHRTVKKTLFEADLTEEIVEEDATSGQTVWREFPFHGYSPSGTIHAEDRIQIVYANYGRPSDFHTLLQNGVSIKDRAVLVRYGKCFRGLKVKNAQRLGAKAVIIYSDPADDGFVLGKTYPEGPWRPPSGIQRGSVQFNSQCAGDPFRIDGRYNGTTVQSLCGVESSSLIPSIPSIPISYRDALPILQDLSGPIASNVDPSFAGGLTNSTLYRFGPSRSYIEMRVNNRFVNTSIPNVIGFIPGTDPPSKDMPVLVGNHRDAWVFGAADPNSGTAVLLEVVKGLGYLYRHQGWRPKRSIYFLSWSGEEYGLLGSTGWGELHGHTPIIQRALVYLNSDTTVSGDMLRASASPSLIPLWKDVLDDLENESILQFANPPYGDIRDANTDTMVTSGKEFEYAPSGNKTGILGSGSDYTVFLDHFGIPSLDFAFSKQRASYGQYHSIYDSFHWMEKFGGRDGEPQSAFNLMVDAAKIWGLLVIRLATTELVPLDQTSQGNSLQNYLNRISDQLGEEGKTCSLNTTGLVQAVSMYQKCAADVHSHCSSDPDDSLLDECNEKIGLVERSFLLDAGLPGRSWFRHCLQAPGIDLGYAAEAFPGIQQALDVQNCTLAQDQVGVTAQAIRDAATKLKFFVVIEKS